MKITFDFAPVAAERLNSLKMKTHADSHAQVIANALRLYEWLLDQNEQGYSFGLVKDDVIRTVRVFHEPDGKPETAIPN